MTLIFFTTFEIQEGILFSLGKQLRSRSGTMTAKRPLQGKERLHSVLISIIQRAGRLMSFVKEEPLLSSCFTLSYLICLSCCSLTILRLNNGILTIT